jgi:hypothetical protein
MKRLKLALLAIGISAMAASADTIVFTATSNGFALSMHVAGVDSQGDTIDATFLPGDIASVPNCGCAPGTPIQVIEGWDGVGTAIVNGVTYSTFFNLIGGNEGGLTTINGVMPPITGAPGSHVDVTFPITWNMDVFFYTNVVIGSPPSFVELKGSGVGTASADMLILDDGILTYNGDNFSYASTPEPSTGIMLGLGLIVGIGVRRKAAVK